VTAATDPQTADQELIPAAAALADVLRKQGHLSDDGQVPVADGKGVPTSSLSEPAIVAGFLELLDVRDGNTVVEIGTGAGWTAALLSHRLGAQRVTTIEVDQQVARRSATSRPPVTAPPLSPMTARWAGQPEPRMTGCTSPAE
jgi:predicted O-methyltransferase YrrM